MKTRYGTCLLNCKNGENRNSRVSLGKRSCELVLDDLGAEFFCRSLHVRHPIRAVDALWETGEVLDLGGRGERAVDEDRAAEDEQFELGAGGVGSGGAPEGPESITMTSCVPVSVTKVTPPASRLSSVCGQSSPTWAPCTRRSDPVRLFARSRQPVERRRMSLFPRRPL
ncbi:hypothetical protein [Streptomyces sp. NBC_01262]|uniref:hypothetical protein n=1 Tax=Streptomyces sp. NBC_01262 TaxID=2903803 RepID=UPI003FCCEFC3